jgi:CBS domain-containing protein
MSLERFCRKAPITGSPEESVDRIAERMREAHVGAVVIVDQRRAPVGILTDRDIVCRVVAEHRSAEATLVSDVMTAGLEILHTTESIDHALFTMRNKGVRRLPIVDGEERLQGLVALDDLLVLLSAELGQTAAAVRTNEGP